MSIESTKIPTANAERSQTIVLYLTFATFAIVWLSLMAGAFLRVWALSEVRDLIILLVGLQAGNLASNPIQTVSRIIARPTAEAKINT